MSVATCPRCRDEITVPMGVHASARVRCPLCRDEMLLSEVLNRMPPMLEVLDAPHHAEEWQAEAVSGHETYAVAEEAESPLLAGAVGQATAPFQPSGTISGGLRPKRQANPAGEIIKIVLGGVVGVVMALAVLWYGLKKDPLNLGPVVAGYLPSIVPNDFRGPHKVKPSTENNVPAPLPPNPAATQPTTNKPSAQKPPEAENGQKGGFQDPRFSNALTGKKPEDAGADNTPTSLEPGPNAAELTQHFAAVQLANEAFTGTDPSEKEERKRLGTELYNTCAEFGGKIAAADPRDPTIEQILPTATETLAQAVDAPGKQSMMGFLAGQRLATPEAEQGIALPAVVKTFSSAGSWFEIQVETVGRDPRAVTVVTRQNPQDVVKADDRVFILGRVQPDLKKLKGYRGKATDAVQCGLLVPIP